MGTLGLGGPCLTVRVGWQSRTLPDRRDTARVGDGLVAGEHERVFAGGALACQRSGADDGVVDVEVKRQQVYDFLVHWIDGASLVRADDGLDGAE